MNRFLPLEDNRHLLEVILKLLESAEALGKTVSICRDALITAKLESAVKKINEARNEVNQVWNDDLDPD